MYENLKQGDYVPGKGYFHQCAFPKCSDPPFFGRKYQKYHPDCKRRMDAERAATKHEKTKEENQIMAKNLSILEELYPRSRGVEEIPKIDLIIRGFDFLAPTRRIKTERYGHECQMVHGYAYRYILNKDSIIIYTKNELRNF